MSQSDFIADFITVIRNASRAGIEKVTVPASNVTFRIAEILQQEGFIKSVKIIEEDKKRFARIHLKYVQGKKSAIQGLKRFSKPGLRRYASTNDIPKVQGGLGIAIVSTSKGVLADRDAKKQNAGGEVLCTVW